MMDDIFESIKNTRQHLISEIVDMDSNLVNFKPNLNSWSIGQVCQHLCLTEVSFSKAVSLGLGKEDTLIEIKPIDIILDRNSKFEAPDIAKPNEEYFNSGVLIEKLNESRRNLMIVLDIDDPSKFVRKSYNHPFFKELLLSQWIELLGLHEQRHIKQIRDIKSKVKRII